MTFDYVTVSVPFNLYLDQFLQYVYFDISDFKDSNESTLDQQITNIHMESSIMNNLISVYGGFPCEHSFTIISNNYNNSLTSFPTAYIELEYNSHRELLQHIVNLNKSKNRDNLGFYLNNEVAKRIHEIDLTFYKCFMKLDCTIKNAYSSSYGCMVEIDFTQPLRVMLFWQYANIQFKFEHKELNRLKLNSYFYNNIYYDSIVHNS